MGGTSGGKFNSYAGDLTPLGWSMARCTSWSHGTEGARTSGTWPWSARPPVAAIVSNLVLVNHSLKDFRTLKILEMQVSGCTRLFFACRPAKAPVCKKFGCGVVVCGFATCCMVQGVQPKSEEWLGNIYLDILACLHARHAKALSFVFGLGLGRELPNSSLFD